MEAVQKGVREIVGYEFEIFRIEKGVRLILADIEADKAYRPLEDLQGLLRRKSTLFERLHGLGAPMPGISILESRRSPGSIVDFRRHDDRVGKMATPPSGLRLNPDRLGLIFETR